MQEQELWQSLLLFLITSRKSGLRTSIITLSLVRFVRLMRLLKELSLSSRGALLRFQSLKNLFPLFSSENVNCFSRLREGISFLGFGILIRLPSTINSTLLIVSLNVRSEPRISLLYLFSTHSFAKLLGRATTTTPSLLSISRLFLSQVRKLGLEI